MGWFPEYIVQWGKAKCRVSIILCLSFKKEMGFKKICMYLKNKYRKDQKIKWLVTCGVGNGGWESVETRGNKR